MKKKITIILIIAFSLNLKASSKNGGKSSFAFLKIGEGVGVLSKAKIPSISYDDIFIASKNSSFLTKINFSEISFAHIDWLGLSSGEQFAASLNFFPINLGIVTNFFSIPDVEIRTRPGEPQAKFDASYYMTAICLAYPFDENLSFGASFKYIGEILYDETYNVFAFDLSSSYFININKAAKANFAASISNAEFNNNSNLPTSFNLSSGCDYKIESLKSKFRFGAEYSYMNDRKKGYINFGFEVLYFETISFSIGNQNLSDLYSISYGISIFYKNLKISYAYLPIKNNFDNSQLFGVSYMFK